MTIVITAASHPHLRQAFEDMEWECGRYLADAAYRDDRPDFSRFVVPPPWSRYADAADHGLARLHACGQDDWDSFVAGDQDDRAILVELQGDLAEAAMLLDALVDDWPVDGAEAVS